jgi:hypothetical protein
MVLGWIRESFRGGIAIGCCGECCKNSHQNIDTCASVLISCDQLIWGAALGWAQETCTLPTSESAPQSNAYMLPLRHHRHGWPWRPMWNSRRSAVGRLQQSTCVSIIISIQVAKLLVGARMTGQYAIGSLWHTCCRLVGTNPCVGMSPVAMQNDPSLDSSYIQGQ